MHRVWEQFFSETQKAERGQAGVLPDRSEDQGLSAALAKHEAALLSYPNVVGVSAGIRTRRGRPNFTFFGNGIVAHIAFADPVCKRLHATLAQCARAAGATAHVGGTYVNMEGPAFSTRAESNFHRAQGWDVIGMPNLGEARCAREAEICYATLALATDYDCWHETEEDVSVDAVLAVLRDNVTRAQEILHVAVKRVPRNRDCPCARALENAIITDSERIPASVKKDLELLIGKYL